MGSTTGKEIVQNPLIRKVDITVGRYYSLSALFIPMHISGWDENWA
jgi:hypothetical protein